MTTDDDRSAEFPEEVREAVLRRDGYVCRCCGTSLDLEVDHLWPVDFMVSAYNAQVLCHPCNREKGTRYPYQEEIEAVMRDQMNQHLAAHIREAAALLAELEVHPLVLAARESWIGWANDYGDSEVEPSWLPFVVLRAAKVCPSLTEQEVDEAIGLVFTSRGTEWEIREPQRWLWQVFAKDGRKRRDNA